MKWIVVAAYLVLIASVIYFHFNEFKQRERNAAKEAEDRILKDIERNEKFIKERVERERQFEMVFAAKSAKIELLQAKSKAIKRRKILLKIMAKQPTS